MSGDGAESVEFLRRLTGRHSSPPLQTEAATVDPSKGNRAPLEGRTPEPDRTDRDAGRFLALLTGREYLG